MIKITSIKQPERGAVMMFHCNKCAATTIMVNEYAIKPNDGDAWKVEGHCVDFPLHNLDWPPPKFEVPAFTLHDYKPFNYIYTGGMVGI